MESLLSVSKSIEVFKQLGVTMVVRLNSASYSSQLYEQAGIKHRDLVFPDGSEPPIEIVNEFLNLVESEKGLVAVHCKVTN